MAHASPTRFCVDPATVAAAFVVACEAELDAPKPGNVHHFAPGHGMDAEDFLKSAHVAAQYIAQQKATVGQRILGAVDATWAAVGQNTNLGIVLLCAPLAQAALTAQTGDLRIETGRIVAGLDLDDADLAFRAIARANPAGLGAAAQHDVTEPARTTLLEAMRAAAHRDSVARQYANGFSDIFGLGFSALAAARASGQSPQWATLSLYAAFFAQLTDSHIARKFGLPAAELARADAKAFKARLDAASAEGEAFALALAFDADLKARGLNPGTSADLTVATLFADSLASNLASILASARKNV